MPRSETRPVDRDELGGRRLGRIIQRPTQPLPGGTPAGVLDRFHEEAKASRGKLDEIARAFKSAARGPGVLETATITIPTSGVFAADHYRVPYASIAIYNSGTSQCIVASGSPQGSAPGGGQGMFLLPAGAFRSVNLAGSALSIYGTAGTILDYTVMTSRIHPAGAALLPAGPMQFSLFAGSGPATGTAYPSGDLVEGIDLGVTTGGVWLDFYRIWILPTAESLTGFQFALYQVTGSDVGTLVPGSQVTAGALVAGAWNEVPLAAPLLLSPAYASDAIGLTYGAAYMACVGNSGVWGAFPETKNIFGVGDPKAAGIVQTPLFAFSSLTGSQPVGGTSEWIPQDPFTTAIQLPSSGMPTQNDTDANLWCDVVVGTGPPASPSYRMLPNMPVFNAPGVGPQTGNYTLGTKFTLSEPCTPTLYWHYSAPGCTALPLECVIWTAGGSQVPGTLIASPSWSGAAGSGWISCPYTGPELAAGSYIASDYGTGEWFLAQTLWWTTAFPSGIAQGPVTYTGSCYNLGVGLTFPATQTVPGSGEYDGVDLQLIPF